MEKTNIVHRQLSELTKAPINIRMHPEKQMHEYRRSVRKNGILKLLVIDENNVIWCGNGLYEAMKAEGYTECDCILKTGMTDADKKKMMMSENKIFDLGVDDMAVFDKFIAEFDIDDLDIPGYSVDLLESLKLDGDYIDDIVSEYGTIDADKKAEITQAREQMEQERRTARPDNPYTPMSERTTETTEPVKNQEPLICPHCGGKIWL